jgi:LAO/AO transport system kinase
MIWADLVERVLGKERRALARAISWVEDGKEGSRDLLRAIYPHTGKAHIVGITGSPGVGKSTMVDALAVLYRAAGSTLGIIAVDPTSPLTGGALLGDRIRMNRHGTDPGVFIRSLASRGRLGGLSRSTGDVIRLMEAFGLDVVVVETVGSGQAEVDIMRYAHTVVVVTAPGLGDEVQVLKAGTMEIGDIFVVNKADRDGADRTVNEIRSLWKGYIQDGWVPPVYPAVAREGQGVQDVYQGILDHRRYLVEEGGLAARVTRGLETQVREILEETVVGYMLRKAREQGLLQEILEEVAGRRLDPHGAVVRLCDRYGWQRLEPD